jgi:DNA polymerase-1
MRLVFDIETNGFLDVLDQAHCIGVIDVDSGVEHSLDPSQLGAALVILNRATELIGHNILSFDLPALLKVFGWAPGPEVKITDTLVWSRVAFSDLKNADIPRFKKWKTYEQKVRFQPGLKAPPEFPGDLVGKHSLLSWGRRLGGVQKGDYSEWCEAQGIDPWAQWRPEMQEYMMDDVRLNLELLKHLERQEVSPQALELEHRAQAACTAIENDGWPFDEKAAQELYATLAGIKERMALELRALFPPWKVPLPDMIPKRDNGPKGYLKGVPVKKWKMVEFNPGSRDQIADRLKDKYKWKPSVFTDGGAPKIDDEVLTGLPYPEAQELAKYFTIIKRLSQLATGDTAWLTKVTKGKIHGRYNPNGTVTGRASHFGPNVGQVPGVGAEYGRDCRALFGVLPGWYQVGADQQGLEARCLASYMRAFDGGAYEELLLNGDVHWANSKAIYNLDPGTVRDEKCAKHKLLRDTSKTIFYALLYGSGDPNLGTHLGGGAAEGAGIRKRLMVAFPALERLTNYVKKASKKGHLKGLDGRKIPVRTEHAALNSLLQSAGAILCKQWLADCRDALKALGLKQGWDGDFVMLGWIHDEIQFAFRDHVDFETVKAIIIKTGQDAGKPFPAWNCRLDVEAKRGLNWAECH